MTDKHYSFQKEKVIDIGVDTAQYLIGYNKNEALIQTDADNGGVVYWGYTFESYMTDEEEELGVSADFIYQPGEMTFNANTTYSAGAVIVIKNSKGEIVYKFESKTTAEIITDLEYGTYTVEELSAPEGYIKSNNVASFTIDKDHLSHQIVIENTKETIVPDTANASSMILLMIGIVITGFGISYVRKNGQKKFSK